MMETSRFLFIESNTTGTGTRFLAVASELGLEPLLVCQDPARYRRTIGAGIPSVIEDTTDRDRLRARVAQLAAEAPVAGIYSSSEYFVQTAAALARDFGLPGADPEAIACCRNKRAQRERLRDASVTIPCFVAVQDSDEVPRALDALPFPVVVKPIWGSGSVGVRLCRTEREAASQARTLLAQTVNERGMPVPREILVEAYCDGDEYSVELVNGVAVGVTRKHLSAPPAFIETGHDYPAPLPAATSRRLSCVARAALNAVGLRWGPAHVEIRMTSAGPAVIEINPRLAGGFIPELVRQASGIDLIRETVVAASGGVPRLVRTRRRSASIRFLLCPDEGELVSVGGAEGARARPYVTDVRIYKSPGDPLTLHGDFRDRIGHVLCAGRGSDIVADAATCAVAELDVRILTTPASMVRDNVLIH